MNRLKRFRWDKQYLYWGITAFLVVAASIVFYIFLTRIYLLKEGLNELGRILSPFIWGMVIAYLLCPLMNILQRSVFTQLGAKIFRGRENAQQMTFKFSRGCAVFSSIIILFVVISALIGLVAPRLYYSLESIVLISSEYLVKANDWLDRFLKDYPEIESAVSAVFGNGSEGIVNWLKDIIMPWVNAVAGSVKSGVITSLKGIYNILIGVIVSIYVMYNKELFGANVRKVIYCIFSVEAAEKIIKAVDFIDQVFIGFLSGKILDSLIISVICYGTCLLLKMPYALLISCIIGITNIIPFFGPIIGAIPSAIIILMESPVQCLIFIVFVLVLQQFDGNILGPKILGSSVGINGFWILFAIIVGAGLFGFAGMLLGVPVFVVLYTGVTNLINRKLERSGLPTEEKYYENLDYISSETGEAVFKEENRRRTGQKSPFKSIKDSIKKIVKGKSASGPNKPSKQGNASQPKKSEKEENASGKGDDVSGGKS